MAEVSSVTDDLYQRLQDYATCAVCKDRLQNPKILHCFHSFCAACIQRVFRESISNNYAVCPLCRGKFFPTNQNTSNLPASPVQGILDILNTHERTLNKSAKSYCGLCRKMSSIANICMDCNNRMCENCSIIHHRIQQEHTVLPFLEFQGTPILDIMNETDKSRFCRIHEKKEVTSFCKSCDRHICRECESENCKNHCRSPFSAAAKDIKNFLTAGLVDYIPKISVLEEQLKFIRNHQKHLEKSVSVTKTKIEQEAAKYRDLINKCEKTCLEDVDKLFSEQDQEIEKLLGSVEIHFVELKSLHDHMKYLLKYGTTKQLSKCERIVKQKIDQITIKELSLKSLSESKFCTIAFANGRNFDKIAKCIKLGDVVSLYRAIPASVTPCNLSVPITDDFKRNLCTESRTHGVKRRVKSSHY